MMRLQSVPRESANTPMLMAGAPFAERFATATKTIISRTMLNIPIRLTDTASAAAPPSCPTFADRTRRQLQAAVRWSNGKLVGPIGTNGNTAPQHAIPTIFRSPMMLRRKIGFEYGDLPYELYESLP